MASLQQPATGYRTQYYNCGSFLSVTFPILRECKKQLKERETENAIEPAHRIGLGELLRGYGKKSSIKQKPATDESRRIKRLKDRCLDRMGKSIGDVNTNNVSPGVGQDGQSLRRAVHHYGEREKLTNDSEEGAIDALTKRGIAIF